MDTVGVQVKSVAPIEIPAIQEEKESVLLVLPH